MRDRADRHSEDSRLTEDGVTGSRITEERITDSRIMKDGGDILDSERFRKAKTIPHHNTNVAEHSLNTSEAALRICVWLKRRGIRVDQGEVIRACLLHDIGMTEEVVHHSVSWKKAYSHPRTGAQIARREYGVKKEQEEAIRRHMWPVCVIPPKNRIGWIVIAADKYSSIKEMLKKIHRIRREDS